MWLYASLILLLFSSLCAAQDNSQPPAPQVSSRAAGGPLCSHGKIGHFKSITLCCDPRCVVCAARGCVSKNSKVMDQEDREEACCLTPRSRHFCRDEHDTRCRIPSSRPPPPTPVMVQRERSYPRRKQSAQMSKTEWKRRTPKAAPSSTLQRPSSAVHVGPPPPRSSPPRAPPLSEAALRPMLQKAESELATLRLLTARQAMKLKRSAARLRAVRESLRVHAAAVEEAAKLEDLGMEQGVVPAARRQRDDLNGAQRLVGDEGLASPSVDPAMDLVARNTYDVSHADSTSACGNLSGLWEPATADLAARFASTALVEGKVMGVVRLTRKSRPWSAWETEGDRTPVISTTTSFCC